MLLQLVALSIFFICNSPRQCCADTHRQPKRKLLPFCSKLALIIRHPLQSIGNSHSVLIKEYTEVFTFLLQGLGKAQRMPGMNGGRRGGNQ